MSNRKTALLGLLLGGLFGCVVTYIFVGAFLTLRGFNDLHNISQHIGGLHCGK